MVFDAIFGAKLLSKKRILASGYGGIFIIVLSLSTLWWMDGQEKWEITPSNILAAIVYSAISLGVCLSITRVFAVISIWVLSKRGIGSITIVWILLAAAYFVVAQFWDVVLFSLHQGFFSAAGWLIAAVIERHLHTTDYYALASWNIEMGLQSAYSAVWETTINDKMTLLVHWLGFFFGIPDQSYFPLSVLQLLSTGIPSTIATAMRLTFMILFIIPFFSTSNTRAGTASMATCGGK